jgi:site-specific DNA-methyltransferase (adenine-specific)
MKKEILHGEAIEELTKLPDQSVEMCLTDLPYGVTNNDWDAMIEVEAIRRELKRVIKKDGAILLFARGLYLAELMLAHKKSYKFKYIWKKNRATNPHNVKVKPLENFEEIAVFCYGKLPYYPQKTTGHQPSNAAVKKANSTLAYRQSKETKYAGGQTTRYPKTVLEFAGVDNDSPVRVHTNQKPVDMLQFLIRQHSRPGDTVLDFCCGSGSTGVAAFIEKRGFILIDKGRHWVNHARNWIAKLENSPVQIPIGFETSGMPLFECQKLLDAIGPEKFRAESQHEF